MISRWLLALALLINHGLVADRAHAQTPEVTLTVNQADLAVLSEGLGQLPYVKVAPLMQKLQAQVIKQQQPDPKAEPQK